MTQGFQQNQNYPSEIYDSSTQGSFYSGEVNVPQQPVQQIPKQQVQQRQIQIKGVDITFRYNEQDQTYKKIRFERNQDNLLLILIEGRKGQGNNRVVFQLSLEDIQKIYWVLNNYLKEKENEFKL